MARVIAQNISEFQRVLIKWYQQNGREFSWRCLHLSDYHYVIAEILLQRTRAETVEKVFDRFLNRFSNWNDLSTASVKTIEAALEPVGLQKQRALRLHQLATEIMKRGEQLPSDRATLEQIPFLGQYIANAIELIVFKRRKPLLDVNMARLLERYFSPRRLSDIRYDPFLQRLSHRVVDHVDSLRINWAILDFAALVCRPRPNCQLCPLRKKCTYFRTVASLPSF